jgi:hypothetical protein
MTYTLSIGVISEGTLNPQDLACACLPLVENIPDFPAALLTELKGVANGSLEDDDSMILADVWDTLSEHVPAYCYFGPIEGDGACIGVWPDWYAIDMDERDGEILRVSDLSDTDDWGGSFALLVNDHGNVTLYERDGDDWHEVWSVV